MMIEKKNRIGGHTETYTDPASGIPIDIGVIVFHNLTIVKEYFARFNVPLIPFGSDADPNAPAKENGNYDLRTGKEVNVLSPTAEAVGAAFAKYTEQLQKYPRLNDGMFLPNPIPEDLILPFGEFVKKYGVEDALVTMFAYDPGLGDILTIPTVEIMRVLGLSAVQQLQGGFLTTARRNNSELYTKASAELLAAQGLLLSSEVVHADRSDEGVKLVVKTPTGLKLIQTKKLLITIPPKLDFLRPFDLSTQERQIFGKLINAGYYTTLVKNTGLLDNLSITNYVQNSPYNLPTLPSVYSIGSTGVPGLHLTFYGAPRTPKTYPLRDAVVKADVINSIKTLQEANPDKFNQTEPELVIYRSHAPFYLQARPEDTKNGFYEQMYALQGLRNTYWTGASWRSHDSSVIWRFTQNEVLPKLLAGL